MLLQQLHLPQSVCLFFSLSARGPNPWSFNEKRWMKMPRQKFWVLLWTPWTCIHYKGNNLHSTVNLCPGNGLVTTRHILVGQKGSQGKSKLSLWRKLRMFLSLAINRRFWFWTFLTLEIYQNDFFGLNISLARNLFKQIWFERFSRSESI